MKIIKFLSAISLIFPILCSDPISKIDDVKKGDIIGTWALFRIVTNVGIEPVFDITSRTWIGNDTITCCDTCINTFYIIGSDSICVFNRHSLDASPMHTLFISAYSLLNNRIESAIDTFNIFTIHNDVIHLVKNNRYYFLKKHNNYIPPSFWPDWQTDTIRLN